MLRAQAAPQKVFILLFSTFAQSVLDYACFNFTLNSAMIHDQKNLKKFIKAPSNTHLIFLKPLITPYYVRF